MCPHGVVTGSKNILQSDQSQETAESNTGEGVQVTPAERDFTEPLSIGLGALKLPFPRPGTAPCFGNPNWPQPHGAGVQQSPQGLSEAQAGAARVEQVKADKAMDATSGYP